MRKYYEVSAVFLTLVACHATHVTPAAMGDEPTLAILGEDGVTCGAVALTTMFAVTANHCVPEKDVSFVTASRTGEADRTGFGVVVAREATSDLAVFRGAGFVPATLADGSIDYEHATTLVTHVPVPWSVAKLHPSDAREGYLQTELLESGMSGSGLWDDGGRLVGIAVGNDAHGGYFAGAARIRKLLNETPLDAPLKQAPPSAALWGDPALSIDELIASAKLRREHIGAALDRLEHQHEN